MIDLQKLGQWLKDWRTYRGRSSDEIAREVAKLGEAITNPDLRRVVDLEEGRISGRCEFREAVSLASAYQMTPLMLDHLESEARDIDVLKFSLHENDLHSPKRGSEIGQGAEYKVPKQRLAATDSILVHLRLIKDGQSDLSHHHPGDELQFVLRGNILVEFHNNGISTELKQHDYIHFYAERPHTSYNIGSEDAIVLVVRMYQITHGGPRRRLINNIKDFQTKLSQRPRSNKQLQQKLASLRKNFRLHLQPWLTQMTQDWLRQITEQPLDDKSSFDRIRDPVGLARLLKTIATSGNDGWSLREMVANSQNQTSATGESLKIALGALRSFCAGLPSGRATAKDLKKLAGLVGIPPILLCGCLFPRVLGAIVVRSKDDWFSVPKESAFEPPEGVTYEIPIRNLADSNATILFLSMEAGARSHWNSHAGFELCFPLSGKDIEIRFSGEEPPPQVCDSGRHEYAHFLSHHRHQIINNGSEPALILLVRFHEYSHEMNSEDYDPTT